MDAKKILASNIVRYIIGVVSILEETKSFSQ